MSLSPANELWVVLAAGQVLAARAPWSWNALWPGRRPGSPVQRDVAPAEDGAPWKNALDAFESLVREQAPGTRVRVTLSNSLVRYALLPSQAKLRGSEEQAYVSDCFSQLYGEAATGWDICTARSPGAVRVASAVDAQLMRELVAACANAGVTLASLRPLLSCVVNRWRRDLRSYAFWLVLAEPGALCIALIERRQWRVLRTVRSGDDWLEGLPALLERETLLAAGEADIDKVFLWSPQLVGETPEKMGRWPVTLLAAELRHGVPPAIATWFGVGR